jgi:hypothetical protein
LLNLIAGLEPADAGRPGLRPRELGCLGLGASTNRYVNALPIDVFAVADRDDENGLRPVLNLAHEPVITDPILPVPLSGPV